MLQWRHHCKTEGAAHGRERLKRTAPMNQNPAMTNTTSTTPTHTHQKTVQLLTLPQQHNCQHCRRSRNIEGTFRQVGQPLSWRNWDFGPKTSPVAEKLRGVGIRRDALHVPQAHACGVAGCVIAVPRPHRANKNLSFLFSTEPSPSTTTQKSVEGKQSSQDARFFCNQADFVLSHHVTCLGCFTGKSLQWVAA